ncbi:hypothetical protein ACXAUS_004079 [Clostridium sporogenes]|uniref:DUF4321 domain-containing protein n=1 Tax=Clostridium tepidum TaxID=1962263 RepID=A0ABX3L0R9_9CLOT|nr:hypothetical protein [Clostridium tepidum]OOO61269.1 hypothetical protein BS637_13280 [Clostridium tepidum]
MIRDKLFRLSLLIELILTFFVSAKTVKETVIIVYKYGFPFRYLDVYSEKIVDENLIVILTSGNSGVNLNLIPLIGNIAIIYAIIYFIDFIVKKQNK